MIHLAPLCSCICRLLKDCTYAIKNHNLMCWLSYHNKDGFLSNIIYISTKSVSLLLQQYSLLLSLQKIHLKMKNIKRMGLSPVIFALYFLQASPSSFCSWALSLPVFSRGTFPFKIQQVIDQNSIETNIF